MSFGEIGRSVLREKLRRRWTKGARKGFEEKEYRLSIEAAKELDRYDSDSTYCHRTCFYMFGAGICQHKPMKKGKFFLVNTNYVPKKKRD